LITLTLLFRKTTLEVNGKCFTWKKRINGSWVFEKLDRGIARHDYVALYLNISAVHGSFTFSDHCPLIITTEPLHHRNIAAPFRFQYFWTKYQQLNALVTKKWKSPVKGIKMFQLSQKLKGLKLAIKPWAKSTFGNFQDKLHRNLDKINYVEGQLIDDPMNSRLNDWPNRLIKQREKMLLFNQKFWGRLARKDWLVNGDRNSTYFQR